MFMWSFPARPICRLGWASVTVAIAIAPRSMITTSPTLTSSKTSKSTRSSTFASLDDIVRANLILIGVSSAKPNANGAFGAGAELWAEAAFGSLGAVVCDACCGSADDEPIRQNTATVAIRITVFIVFSFVESDRRETKVEPKLPRMSVSIELLSGELLPLDRSKRLGLVLRGLQSDTAKLAPVVRYRDR